MGKVLLWLLGVPMTVAVLFAVFGEHSNANAAHEGVAVASLGSDR